MARAPSHALSRRHAAARAAMASRSLDALVLTSLPNILYLTNFSGSAAIVLLDGERVRFITDSRYASALAESSRTPEACPALELVVTAGSYDGTLVTRLAEYATRRVGFEAAHVTISRHAWWTSALSSGPGSRDAPPILVPTEGIVEGARLRKDAYELEVFREAGRRLSGVARELLATRLLGRSEREVAADIDWRIRRAGFEKPAFDTIVASGPNAALPHARPSERILSEGDLVVLDFGGVYASYCVDLTRTVSVGPASPRGRAVHAAVLEAHRRALAAVVPGVSRFDVDAAARDALADAGMAEAFGHGTGHGLGIDIHEAPRLVQRRSDVDARDEAVEVGMVFTIEPGAYFAGWGGVRIEDDLVVTEKGPELLTDVTTQLLEV